MAVVLDQSTVRAIMKGPEVESIVREQAQRVAATANGIAHHHGPMREDFYAGFATTGFYTALGHVMTRGVGGPSPLPASVARDNKHMTAVHENAKNHTLQKALASSM